MAQVTTPTNDAPITYPDRIYNGKDFDTNINRDQSSDSLTTVLTDKNEVLGFPDHTSKQEMQAAIEADRNGSISTYKPTFYDKFIRQPLQNIGMVAFQPPFITDIKPTPERAFATSFARAATADIFKPDFSDQEAKANPIPAFAGGLAGSVAAFATGGALLDGMKLSQLTPFAENIIKGGILGGAYRGISDTSNELRDQDHPDLAKIGQSVLHDALWWGGISGLTGAASKPVGIAASAGLGYLMAKSDGADEPSALLNGAVLGGFHLLQAHGDQEDVRQLVTDKLQSNVADYILAKNPMVHEEVAKQGGREFIANHVEDAIEQANNGLAKTGIETPQAKEIEEEHQKGVGQILMDSANKMEQFKGELAKGEEMSAEVEKKQKEDALARFGTPEEREDGYNPKTLNYLSQYIPVDRLVRMSGTDRSALAKEPIKTLENYRDQYQQMSQILSGEKSKEQMVPDVDRMISEGGPVNTLEEAVKSKTILNQVMKNMTKQVMLKEGGENVGKGKESGEAKTSNDLRDDGQAEETGREEVVNRNQPHRAFDNNLNDVLDESSGKAQLQEQGELSKSQKESEPIVDQESSLKESIPSEEVKNKSSGLSKSVEEDAIHKGLIEDLGDLPSYKTRNMEEIAKKVKDFIDKDIELAKKIAFGDAPEQDGLRAQELFTGLKVKAFSEGDVSLIHELGTSEKASAMATELGQRVKALDSKDSENPINIVKDIQKSKEKLTKEMMNDQGKTVKILKKEFDKTSKKQDWNSFIESIKC